MTCTCTRQHTYLEPRTDGVGLEMIVPQHVSHDLLQDSVICGVVGDEGSQQVAANHLLHGRGPAVVLQADHSPDRTLGGLAEPPLVPTDRSCEAICPCY